MMNEEFERRWERKVEFLLNQQAKFDADMVELKEGHKQLQEGQKELQEAQKATEEKLGRLTNGLMELRDLTHEGFKITFEWKKDLVESQKNTDAKIAALVDRQIQTDEMIRNIGTKLDRHLNEDHNGSKS